MCVTSMIGEHFGDKWTIKPQTIEPYIWPYPISGDQPTKQEFDDLKKEVLEMKELLKKAIKYDKENNQPDCEIDEKMKFLKQVAKLVGIDLDEVFHV